MATDLAEGTSAQLLLEYVDDPSWLGVDPATGAAHGVIALAVNALSALAPRPGDARLVLTGDFVRSVQERLPPGEAETFGLRRGSGVVAGKTMPGPDGVTDVLVPASSFLVYPDETPEIAAIRALRTVLHECGHVAMEQNNQAFVPPDDAGWRAGNLLLMADLVVAEYRAELCVPAGLRAHDANWNGLEIASALRADLSRVNALYQADREVLTLAHHVTTVALVAWKTLSFMAAAARVLPGHEPVPAETAADPVWRRVVEPHWDAFGSALARSAPATEAMTGVQLAEAMVAVAEVLGRWLDDLGFVFGQTPDGQEVFLITKWDLLDPAFAAESVTDLA